MSVARLLRKLNLRPRTRSGNGGSFAYYDAQSGSHLLFLWDGYGLTKSDEIVLFEEEGPGFQTLHIQSHLTQFLFMILSCYVIAKLVWVVPAARCGYLDKIVFSWL